MELENKTKSQMVPHLPKNSVNWRIYWKILVRYAPKNHGETNIGHAIILKLLKCRNAETVASLISNLLKDVCKLHSIEKI